MTNSLYYLGCGIIIGVALGIKWKDLDWQNMIKYNAKSGISLFCQGKFYKVVPEQEYWDIKYDNQDFN